MNDPASNVRPSRLVSANILWALAFLVSKTIIVGVAWPRTLGAHNELRLDRSSLAVTSQTSTTVGFGAIDTASISYSGSVDRTNAGTLAASAQGSAPDTPDQPTGTAVFIGGVDLEWNEVLGADSYDVQLYRNGQWIDLPGNGVDIAFYGAGAIISELNPSSSLWFQVRARNARGSSHWSNFISLPSTNQFEAGRRARPDNVTASGAPSVNGTPQVGETLTADTTGIEDGNGLDRVQYRFQWVSNDGSADTDIPGATDSTYTLKANDEGKTIKVRVAFTDRGGYAESLIAVGTDQVASNSLGHANSNPDLEVGTPSVDDASLYTGSQFTLSVTVTNVGGGESVATRLRYYRSTDSTITSSDTAQGSEAVGALAAAGTSDHDGGITAPSEAGTYYYGACVDSVTDESDTTNNCSSSVTVTVSDSEPDLVVIGIDASDSIETGESFWILVTVTNQGDAQSAATTLRWKQSADAAITTSDMTVGTEAVRALIRPQGNAETIRLTAPSTPGTYYYGACVDSVVGESDTTNNCSSSVAVTLTNSLATGAPTITGTAQVGETLTADTSGIADIDGLSNVSYSFQWIANDGASDADMTGATGSSYTLVAGDQGNTIKVKVSFTDDTGNDESLTSDATVAVAAQAQTNSGPASYITVEVTEDTSDPNNIVTNFIITWTDFDDCSADYNAYLNIKPGTRPGHETPGSQHHLGSAAFDVTEITKGLTGVQGIQGFNVELYCGTEGAGRLVSRVDIPMATARPEPGTYSTEPPLSELSVSHGTLTPTFNSYTSSYAVPDVANADTRMTITAPPKTGYFVKFFEASNGGVLSFAAGSLGGPSGAITGLSENCVRSTPDLLGPLPELTDAGPNTPGFQVDLYDGVNYIHVRAYPTAYCDPGTGYYLTVTRAEGSISLVRPNRPATGNIAIKPYYTYGPCVGCALNAVVSGIGDRDGFDRATFSYQWLADDAEIPGATGDSYTAADTELGKTLKMRVSFTDDRGTDETVTSLATEIVKLRNRESTGKPIIRGRLEVGQTLSADVSGISDLNGMTNATFTYQWVNFYGSATDGEEYTLVDGDEGHSGMWLRVTYTDDAGHEEQVDSDSIGVVAARPNSAATGVPAIAGTLQVGETLTADTAGIADADGLTNVSFSYQWISNDGASDTDIAGATDSAYTLVASDQGNTFKVRVSFTDDAANSETLTSASTAAVAARPNSPATGAPAITGTAQVGETLTANTSGIADNDGLTGVSYSYQWISNDGTSDADITGATGSTYTPVNADEGNTIRVKVIFTDDAGNDESLTSGATSAVSPAQPSEPPMQPQGLTGTVVHDSVSLTWDDPGDATITGYQILRRDRALHGNGDFQVHVDDTGSAAAAYIDRGVSPEGSYVYRIKARNAAGLSGRSGYFRADTPSAPAQNSPATGAPAIGGTARVGETLTTDVSDIADADGLSGATFTYQWVSNDGTSDTDIAGATGSTYTLVASDEGSAIKVRVSFTDDAGYGETLSSGATAAVAAQNSPAIEGVVRVGETLTVDTSGIADLDGLSGVTFSYQWVTNDGTTDTDIAGATGSTYTLTASDEGKVIKVRVTFTVSSAATEEVEGDV